MQRLRRCESKFGKLLQGQLTMRFFRLAPGLRERPLQDRRAARRSVGRGDQEADPGRGGQSHGAPGEAMSLITLLGPK